MKGSDLTAECTILEVLGLWNASEAVMYPVEVLCGLWFDLDHENKWYLWC